MAHTDRDNRKWFWKDHYNRDGACTYWPGSLPGHWFQDQPRSCWCWKVSEFKDQVWIRPYRFERGVPSYYHKDCRRQERARARNMMDRARNGHVDWDDTVINYRRPYFW